MADWEANKIRFNETNQTDTSKSRGFTLERLQFLRSWESEVASLPQVLARLVSRIFPTLLLPHEVWNAGATMPAGNREVWEERKRATGGAKK